MPSIFNFSGWLLDSFVNEIMSTEVNKQENMHHIKKPATVQASRQSFSHHYKLKKWEHNENRHTSDTNENNAVRD